MRGIRAAQAGMLVNAGLVILKLLAGIVGHSHALIADAIESTTDIFSSLIVWGGLRITTRPADQSYPYGYGKAESVAAAVVSLMLLGAAASVAIVAIRGIVTPHSVPAPFTLGVVAGVAVVKELLARRVRRVGDETGSTAVEADAWHHRSDAITSAAVFFGISAALWGGPGWESADDWAALVGSAVIAFNGVRLLRPTVEELMDRMPDGPIIARITTAAEGVAGVCATEKLRVRKHGIEHFVEIHVQADPALSLHDAHVLSGKVKHAIQTAVPSVAGVTVHMEPFEPAPAPMPPVPQAEEVSPG